VWECHVAIWDTRSRARTQSKQREGHLSVPSHHVEDGQILDRRIRTNTVVHAPLGDGVMGGDPTVNELEQWAADLFGKEMGLFVPTGTMTNLVAILSHCDTQASEIMIGASSHLNLWEGKLSLNLFIYCLETILES
jgi:hypothetical protein